MTKLLPWRFKQCFGHFNMLTQHKCSDAGLFRHLSNHDFCNLKFWQISQLWGSSLFSKSSKFDVDFRNVEKNQENILSFRENCIWIHFVKLALLPRQNACHHQSICSETVSRFQILLRQNFSNWSFFKLIEKFD